jgi:hypothetical protein
MLFNFKSVCLWSHRQVTGEDTKDGQVSKKKDPAVFSTNDDKDIPSSRRREKEKDSPRSSIVQGPSPEKDVSTIRKEAITLPPLALKAEDTKDGTPAKKRNSVIISIPTLALKKEDTKDGQGPKPRDNVILTIERPAEESDTSRSEDTSENSDSEGSTVSDSSDSNTDEPEDKPPKAYKGPVIPSLALKAEDMKGGGKGTTSLPILPFPSIKDSTALKGRGTNISTRMGPSNTSFQRGSAIGISESNASRSKTDSKSLPNLPKSDVCTILP